MQQGLSGNERIFLIGVAVVLTVIAVALGIYTYPSESGLVVKDNLTYPVGPAVLIVSQKESSFEEFRAKVEEGRIKEPRTVAVDFSWHGTRSIAEATIQGIDPNGRGVQTIQYLVRDDSDLKHVFYSMVNHRLIGNEVLADLQPVTTAPMIIYIIVAVVWFLCFKFIIWDWAIWNKPVMVGG